MELWHDFFLGELGASAALIGLVFVGVSINLSKIITSSGLVNRAGEALLNLVMVLFTASAALVPTDSAVVKGIIFLVIALIYWGLLLLLQIEIYRRIDPEYRKKFIIYTVIINQVAAICFFLGGLGLSTLGADSLYLIGAATFLAYTTCFIDSWVLLIEIMR